MLDIKPIQPSLQDWSGYDGKPGVETPGYCRQVPLGPYGT
jgi:hypothetical protein